MALGIPWVDDLLESLDPDELDEWRAYERLEPWGEDRADLRIGRLACAVQMLILGDKADWQPEDFAPYVEWPERDPDGLDEAEVMFARLEILDRQFNRVE